MSKRDIQLIELDGFVYQRHDVSINHGKTKIGFVDVLAPRSLEELATAIAKGKETEHHALKKYIAGLAVELQATARAAKKTGKMPEIEFAKIYATLPLDVKKNDWQIVKNKVNEIYAERQKPTVEPTNDVDYT